MPVMLTHWRYLRSSLAGGRVGAPCWWCLCLTSFFPSRWLRLWKRLFLWRKIWVYFTVAVARAARGVLFVVLNRESWRDAGSAHHSLPPSCPPRPQPGSQHRHVSAPSALVSEVPPWAGGSSARCSALAHLQASGGPSAPRPQSSGRSGEGHGFLTFFSGKNGSGDFYALDVSEPKPEVW